MSESDGHSESGSVGELAEIIASLIDATSDPVGRILDGIGTDVVYRLMRLRRIDEIAPLLIQFSLPSAKVLPQTSVELLRRLRRADPDVRNTACAYLLSPLIALAFEARRVDEADSSRRLEELMAEWPPPVFQLALATLAARGHEVGAQAVLVSFTDPQLIPAEWELQTALLHDLESCAEQLLTRPVDDTTAPPVEDPVTGIGVIEDNSRRSLISQRHSLLNLQPETIGAAEDLLEAVRRGHLNLGPAELVLNRWSAELLHLRQLLREIDPHLDDADLSLDDLLDSISHGPSPGLLDSEVVERIRNYVVPPELEDEYGDLCRLLDDSSEGSSDAGVIGSFAHSLDRMVLAVESNAVLAEMQRLDAELQGDDPLLTRFSGLVLAARLGRLRTNAGDDPLEEDVSADSMQVGDSDLHDAGATPESVEENASSEDGSLEVKGGTSSPLSEPALGDSADILEVDLPTAFGQLFRLDKFGLAYWLARANGLENRAQALHAVILCIRSSSQSGELAADLYSHQQFLSIDNLQGDRVMQLLAFAAAVRASIMVPNVSCHHNLPGLTESLAEWPGAAMLGSTVVAAANRGLILDPSHVHSTLNESADRSFRLNDLSTRASEALSPGRRRYARATRMLERWTQRGGLIFRLLTPVIESDLSAIEQIRTLVDELDGRVGSAVDDADREFRGPGHPPLQGASRTELMRILQASLDLSREWLRLVDADAGKRSLAGEATSDEPIHRLSEAIKAARVGLIAALDDAAIRNEDSEIRGAAAAASRILSEAFEAFEGDTEETVEPSPDVALNGELLLTGISLNGDGVPCDLASVTTSAVLGSENNLVAAFDQRAKAGDHFSTKRIADIARLENPALGEELAKRRDVNLEKARERQRLKVEEIRSRADRSRRQGRIEEVVHTAVAALTKTAEQPSRLDYDAVFDELSAAEEQLERAEERSLLRFRDRFAAIIASSAPDLRLRVESLIDDGDLATAEEMLQTTVPGGSVPQLHYEWDVQRYFPDAPQSMPQGLTSEIVASVRDREYVSDCFDFRNLEEASSASIAEGLSAWFEAKNKRNLDRDWLERMRPALRILGIEAEGFQQKKSNRQERMWVTLMEVTRVGEAVLPAFGSQAGGQLLCLMCWDQPSHTQIHGWIAADKSEAPVIVFHFGVMTKQRRLELAELMRREKFRPVIVVDDSALAFLASLGKGSFATTMEVLLPFAHSAPFVPMIAGRVPEEMFYGRRQERSEVVNPNGTSLIFGGRQLGKSALLNAASRQFNVGAQKSVILDLAAVGFGVTRTAASIWDVIARGLEEAGIMQKVDSGKREPAPDRVRRAIQFWLGVDKSRRLLLLIDEADAFFDEDATEGFPNTRMLKDLRDATDARCKPVFAGLHQVQRFSNVPNQPFAHLGHPTAIGPLGPQAALELLTRPLAALGFQFESDDTISRVLGKLNYIPMLIQLFGEALLSQLMTRESSANFPKMISDDEALGILESVEMQAQIRRRFELTLALDPRYKAIAYLVALNAMDGGELMAFSDLTTECRDWWPGGFEDISPNEFRALCEEMVGLGVLANSPDGRYSLRSTNVSQLLGDRDDLEGDLCALESEVPPRKSMIQERRRVFENGVRSPLSEQLMVPLVGRDRNQCVIVIGSRAMDGSSLRSALEATGRATGAFRSEFPGSDRAFEGMCRGLSIPDHHVVLFDHYMTQPSEGEDENVSWVLRTALDKVPTKSSAYTRSAVVLIRPALIGEVRETLVGPNSDHSFRDAVSRFSDLQWIALEKYSPEALKVWALDPPGGFTSEQARMELFRLTGGWPILVNEVARRTLESDPESAVRELERCLQEPEFAGDLLDAVGLSPLTKRDLPLMSTWECLAQLGPDEAFSFGEGVDWVVATNPQIGQAMDCVEALVLGGALVRRSDESLVVDPVLFDAHSVAVSD